MSLNRALYSIPLFKGSLNAQWSFKRKSLPAIAMVVGLENGQGLHHFISQSPWKAEELEKIGLIIH